MMPSLQRQSTGSRAGLPSKETCTGWRNGLQGPDEIQQGQMLSPTHGKGDHLVMIRAGEQLCWRACRGWQRVSWSWADSEPLQQRRPAVFCVVWTGAQLVPQGEWLFPQHSLHHIWMLCPVLFPQYKTLINWSKFTGQPPGWSRAGALALWGETEEAAHVHPGEETAWGDLTAACQGLQSNNQEGRNMLFTAVHGGWKKSRNNLKQIKFNQDTLINFLTIRSVR